MITERIWGPGDRCGSCGESLDPGDLAVWVDLAGRIHEGCWEWAVWFSQNDSERSSDATAADSGRDRGLIGSQR
jgi:hypothetical protein